MSITTGLADTTSYEQRDTRKRQVNPSLGVRAHLTNANVAVVEECATEARPATIPVLTEAEIEDNYRRLFAPVNVIEWVGSDGVTYREYHDPKTPSGESDGRLDTLRVDRGEGTTDSLRLLAKEGGRVHIQGLLGRGARDSRGRFTKT